MAGNFAPGDYLAISRHIFGGHNLEARAQNSNGFWLVETQDALCVDGTLCEDLSTSNKKHLLVCRI